MKKILLSLALVAAVTVACDDENYVIPVPVETVTINEGPIISLTSALDVEFPQLTVTVTPDSSTNKEMYWMSSNPDIISIDPKTGVMTRTDSVIVNVIDVTITARSVNEKDGTVILRLGEGEFVESVAIDQGDGMIDVSNAADAQMPTLTATVAPETVLDKSVTWSSSDPELLAIDPTTGAITRGSKVLTNPEIVTITVTTTNNEKDEIQIKVGEGELPETFSFEGEDMTGNVSVSAGITDIQLSWAQFQEWSGIGQLWWRLENIDPIGKTFKLTFNSTIDNKECEFVGRFTTAQDFGSFDVKLNGKTVGTNIDCRGVLHAVDFALENCTLQRGENTFEVTCTGASNVANITLFGLDKLTFDVVLE